MQATGAAPVRTATLAWSYLRIPILIWLAWRVGLAVVVAGSGGYAFDLMWIWDGNWYRSVLEEGYTVRDPSYTRFSNVVFFPLLPWLTEPFSWVIGTTASAFLVVNAMSLTAFVAIYAAITEARDAVVARWAILTLAVWPSSFVLTAYYSEGLFLTVTALAVWAANRERGALAAAAAFAAGLTRSIGFLLGPVLAVARVVRVGRIDRQAVTTAVAGPASLALLSLVQAVQVDDPLAFVRGQKPWERTFSAPWIPAAGAIDGFIDRLPTPSFQWAVIIGAMFGVFAAMVVLTLWLRRDHLPRWDVIAWGWAAWLSPLLTTQYLSQARYMMAAWPAFAVAGMPTSRAVQAGRLVLLVGLAIASVLLTHKWAGGTFTP